MVKITRAVNGYILDLNDEIVLVPDEEKYEDELENQQHTLKQLFFHIMENYGMYNSKHNKTVIKISVEKQEPN